MSELKLVVCGLPADRVEALRDLGHRVDIADDGYRTIELVERVHPHVVFVHVSAPGPGALELIERVRQAEPECRILFVVPGSEPKRDAELVSSGADGVIVEGVQPSFLPWALDRAAADGLFLDPEVARGLGQAMTEAVTHRAEWARQLAERTRQAEDLARAKSDFLGNVSHELRTPLTIIKGVAATLRMTEKDETQSGMLSQIENATDKLVTMIESIITHASMRRGDYTINVTVCDLADAIRAAAEEASKGHPNVTLDLTIPPRVSAVADVRAIRGIVQQLVDNACRYSDAGGSVSLKARSGDEGMTVHVTDRGVGVNRDKVAAALAEAFSPGEEIMTKERAGLGIGLNLARNLVALHGGILWAEPLPGGGSRVSFTIPPQPVAKAPTDTPTSLASTPS
jgi:signal transduction histidine kinase